VRRRGRKARNEKWYKTLLLFYPRHHRETGVLVSLYLRVRSIKKCEDPEETTADAPEQRKTTAKSETELQIEAPTQEATKKNEEQLRKTVKSFTSAIGLRGSGLFFFYQEGSTTGAATSDIVEKRIDL